MKVEIQKQQVIGWALVKVVDCDDSWNAVEPIVSLVGRDGDDRFEEKQFGFDGDVTGILPAAPGTYRVTAGHDNCFVTLGISHLGDGLSDLYWLAQAEEILRERALDEKQVQSWLQSESRINNQVKKPVHSSNCPSIK